MIQKLSDFFTIRGYIPTDVPDCILWLGGDVGVTKTSEDHLTNGTFETGDITGWNNNGLTICEASIVRKYSGEYSLHCDGSAGNFVRSDNYDATIAGQYYRFRFWYYIEPGSSGIFWNIVDGGSATVNSGALTTTGQWLEFDLTYQDPNGGSSGYVDFFVNGPGDSEFYVDDVRIERCDSGGNVYETSVSEWADQSGNGNDATQNVGVNKPSWFDDQINGQPALSFSDDYLDCNGVAPVIQGDDLPFSIFAVVKRDGTNLDYIFGASFYGDSTSLVSLDALGDEYRFRRTGGIGDSKEAKGATPGDWHLIEAVFTGTTVSMYLDGFLFIEDADVDTSDMGSMDVAMIGALPVDFGPVSPMNGYMAEIVMYSSAVSDEDRQKIEGYISDKYNITLNQVWNPTHIGNCYLWLRPDLGITKDGSNLVSGWADQSGKGNDHSQAMVSRRPVWTPDELNGQPAVIFDEVDDRIKTSAPISITTGITVFAVAYSTRPTTAAYIEKFSNESGLFYNVTNGKVGVMMYEDDEVDIAGITSPYNQITMYRQASSPDFTLRQNGVTLGVVSPGYTGAFWLSELGPALGGGIAEFIVYNSVLSDSDIQKIEAYISARYNIALNQFRPTHIAGCKLWLRTDMGITKDGSDKVSAWADRSGEGNDAAMTYATLRPLWEDGIINGYPTIFFRPVIGGDEADEAFLTINPELIVSGNPPNSTSTVFVVGKMEASTGQQMIFHFNSPNPFRVLYRDDAGTLKLALDSNEAVSSLSLGDSASLTIVCNDPDPNHEITVYENGVLKVETGAGGYGGSYGFHPLGGFLSGYGYYGAGYGYIFGYDWKCAEIIAYDSVLSLSDRRDVEEYLSTRYGLPAPPAAYGFTTEFTVTPGDLSITLPFTDVGTYDCIVDWGDDSTSEITAFNDPDRTHTYAAEGTYQVEIIGDAPGWRFIGGGSYLKCTDIIHWGDPEKFGGFEDIRNGFHNCSNLKSLGPSDESILFANAGGPASLQALFIGCEIITSIPPNLLVNATATTNFQQLFDHCYALESIPSGLFDSNTAVTNMSDLFNQCYALTSVPSGLFDNNTAVTNFAFTFQYCTSLETIPAEIFRLNTNATNFGNTFSHCTKLQVNRNIFYADGEQSTRFFGKALYFYQTFYRDTFTGNQGEAPDLWNCAYGTVTATSCFGGAGNSGTSLSNYASIPAMWK